LVATDARGPCDAAGFFADDKRHWWEVLFLPTVCFKEPGDNAVVTGKKEIQFVALAAALAPGATIDEVRFFEQGTQLGAGGASRCYWTWQDIPPGDHVVTARVSDTNGNIAESPPSPSVPAPAHA
jgi:hypothetical protein